MGCELLAWDSEFFGFQVARVNSARLDSQIAAEVDEWCLQRGVRCLYLLADFSDPETAMVAALHGYVVVDFRVTMRHDLDGLGEPAGQSLKPIAVRRGTADDLEALLPIARSSHPTTRFHFDQRFPRERCRELYARWVERALQDPARELLVAEVDGVPVGYQALRLPDRGEGRLELIAFDQRYRGRGLGIALLLSALRWLAERGAVTVSTRIQARNARAMRMHERAGFVTERTEVWHHRWFEPAGPNRDRPTPSLQI